MAKELNKQQQDALEAMIDGSSLSAVLTSLGEICSGKAEHLQTNWQDRDAARNWDKMNVHIARCTDNARNRRL